MFKELSVYQQISSPKLFLQILQILEISCAKFLLLSRATEEKFCV